MLSYGLPDMLGLYFGFLGAVLFPVLAAGLAMYIVSYFFGETYGVSMDFEPVFRPVPKRIRSEEAGFRMNRDVCTDSFSSFGSFESSFKSPAVKTEYRDMFGRKVA